MRRKFSNQNYTEQLALRNQHPHSQHIRNLRRKPASLASKSLNPVCLSLWKRWTGLVLHLASPGWIFRKRRAPVGLSKRYVTWAPSMPSLNPVSATSLSVLPWGAGRAVVLIVKVENVQSKRVGWDKELGVCKPSPGEKRAAVMLSSEFKMQCWFCLDSGFPCMPIQSSFLQEEDRDFDLFCFFDLKNL